jgi:Uma2 family endonuclease
MGNTAEQLRFSAVDYLAWEAEQSQRHEFADGEIFAMAGANEAHVTAAGDIFVRLRQHLAGTPCRSFITDMKLHVEAANAFYYPDVMVTCSAIDAADPLIKREPVLLVEVLSKSTESIDRIKKFQDYRRLPSLREYLMVDLETRACDLYRQGTDGLWVLHPAAPGADVQLAGVDLLLTGAALWAEVPAPA